MSIENTHAYKYGELTVLARILAKEVKEDIRLSHKGPYGFSKKLMFARANAVLELLEAHEKRGK
tara:strand:+ start:280 stop:471 length:192 start_codon:yes stop_codon:yes gene_type:complete